MASHADPAGAGFVVGSGEMAALIRAKDWSATPLGPIETWPQSLRTTVSLCLASNVPINIIWGPDSTQIYNDSYRLVCGAAHPRALGQGYDVTWASAWDVVGAPFAMARGGGTAFLENQRMFVTRDGHLEETFFTASLSPIRDESGGIGGLFHTVTETTATMLAERRTRALRDLTGSLAAATSVAELARRAVVTLGAFAFDLPFLLIHVLDQTGERYALADAFGLEPGSAACPATLDADATAPWPFAAALRAPLELDDVRARIGAARCGPYEEAPQRAFLLPIGLQADAAPLLMLVAGVSPRLKLDDDYRGFLDLIGAAITAALTTVRAREAERRRAEAPAEPDRARTTFFSNIVHEVRTPLTLMLGPLEQALAEADRLPADQRERIALAHRNGQRLLKLVDALIDFWRIEAGRLQVSFEPTDLAAFTAELASTFDSACTQAGLRLVIDTPALPQPVHLDRDMWEKVVLNLLSNAFRFTASGEIRVSLRVAAQGRAAELTVSDTGTGIPADELPRIFERFHRIDGARGRSHEGSGIGLALVQELVRLHGGRIAVASEPGRGTVFTVTIPFGSHHLPAEQIRRSDAAPRSAAFVGEPLRWLPGNDNSTTPGIGRAAPSSARILLVDDDADMRSHVQRLLAAEGYVVDAVSNGDAALALLQHSMPDLVLSEATVPGLDGFGLLRALRGDALLKDIPVILLSARAGEEARIEGLQAGADDTLAKPFAPRELVARVATNLGLARDRREAALRETETRLRALNADLERQVVQRSRELARTWQVSPDLLSVMDLEEGTFEQMNPAWTTVLGWPPEALWGQPFIDFLHPEDLERSLAAFAQVRRGDPVLRFENRYRRKDGSYCWLSWVSVPEGSKIYSSARDISAEKARAEELARRTAERDRMWHLSTDVMLVADFQSIVQAVNPAWTTLLGWTAEELVGTGFLALIHPDDLAPTLSEVDKLARGITTLSFENRYRHKDGSYRWLSWTAVPDEMFIHAVGRDVTEEKRRQAELAQAQDALRQAQKMEAVGQLTGGVAHDFNNLLTIIKSSTDLLRRPDLPEERRRRYVDAISETVDRAAKLTGQLLAFARRQALKPEIFDVTTRTGAIAEMLASTVGSRIRIARHFAPEPCLVEADPSQFETALVNLAVNARDAMQGEGALTVQVQRVRGVPAIRRHAAKAGEFIAVSITDTGTGIPADKLGQIFEPFYTTKEVGKGTGLGLSQVFGFTKQSGGDVAVESTPGIGTTFTLYLPRVEGAPTRHAPRDATGMQPVEGRPRILVVEDNLEVGRFSTQLLQDLGYETVWATDAAQALEELGRAERFDAVFSDVVMPGMSGIELGHEIRRRKPGLPVVLTSGYSEILAQEGRHGFELLQKPYTVEDLSRVLQLVARQDDGRQSRPRSD